MNVILKNVQCLQVFSIKRCSIWHAYTYKTLNTYGTIKFILLSSIRYHLTLKKLNDVIPLTIEIQTGIWELKYKNRFWLLLFINILNCIYEKFVLIIFLFSLYRSYDTNEESLSSNNVIGIMMSQKVINQNNSNDLNNSFNYIWLSENDNFLKKPIKDQENAMGNGYKIFNNI